MKKFTFQFLLLVAMATAIPAFAQSEATTKRQTKLSGVEYLVIDTIVYITDIDAHTARVYDASSRHGEVEIPSIVSYKNYTDGYYTVIAIERGAFDGNKITKVSLPASITSIDEGAFSGCSALKKINIPDAVTVINKNVFQNCCSLESISIHNTVTSIGEGAFSGCSALQAIVISSNSNITQLGKRAFYNCSNLLTINIADATTSIGDEAFSGCSVIKNVILGKNLKDLGNGVFSNCPNLKDISVTSFNPYFSSYDGLLLNKKGNTLIAFPNGKGDDYVIPAVVDTIGGKAFYGCTFSHFTIPGTVSTIGEFAFEGCQAKSMTIGNGVKSIGNYAFFNCKSLISVTIGAVTNIGVNLFNGCYALTSAHLAEGVTRIECAMFSSCNALTSISIPSSVNIIGMSAFSKCYKLKKVYCKRKEPVYVDTWGFNGVPQSEATLYVPIGSKTAYQQADVWKDFGTITEMSFDIKGDVNEDYQVDVTDLTTLAGYILGASSGINATAADVNGDGKADSSDISALMSIILE